MLNEIFRVVSCFPRVISCDISENRFPLGQCNEIFLIFLLFEHAWASDQRENIFDFADWGVSDPEERLARVSV